MNNEHTILLLKFYQNSPHGHARQPLVTARIQIHLRKKWIRILDPPLKKVDPDPNLGSAF